MRNKVVLENKVERLEVDIKKVGYHIRRQELNEAYDKISLLLEKIEDIKTLLNIETQD